MTSSSPWTGGRCVGRLRGPDDGSVSAVPPRHGRHRPRLSARRPTPPPTLMPTAPRRPGRWPPGRRGYVQGGPLCCSPATWDSSVKRTGESGRARAPGLPGTSWSAPAALGSLTEGRDDRPITICSPPRPPDWPGRRPGRPAGRRRQPRAVDRPGPQGGADRRRGPRVDLRMLAYNGSIPGPTLHVRRDPEITVDVRNDGDVETTVHWHGLRLENRYDGVPHETQEPIPVGGAYTLPGAVPGRRLLLVPPAHARGRRAGDGPVRHDRRRARRPDYWPPVDRELTLTLDDLLVEDGQSRRSAGPGRTSPRWAGSAT